MRTSTPSAGLRQPCRPRHRDVRRRLDTHKTARRPPLVRYATRQSPLPTRCVTPPPRRQSLRRGRHIAQLTRRATRLTASRTLLARAFATSQTATRTCAASNLVLGAIAVAAGAALGALFPRRRRRTACSARRATRRGRGSRTKRAPARASCATLRLLRSRPSEAEFPTEVLAATPTSKPRRVTAPMATRAPNRAVRQTAGVIRPSTDG